METRRAILRFLLGVIAIAIGAWLLIFRPGVHELAAPAGSAAPASETTAPAEPSSSAPTESAPRALTPFRGRVIDAATGEPVAAVRVAAGAAEATTSLDGRFDAGLVAAETEEIRVLDDVHGTRLAALSRTALESTVDGLVVPIDVGPTYRLDLVGIGADELDQWRARLVEIRANGGEVAGELLPIHAGTGGGAPFLRYDAPWRPNDLGSTFRVELHEVRGTRAGASERLSAARGIFPGLVFVRTDRELVRLTGRVVDPLGRPQEGALVLAIAAVAQEAGVGWPTARADADGRFTLTELPPELYEIVARSPLGERATRRRLFLPPGEVPLDDLVLDLAGETREVRGRLESRSDDLAGVGVFLRLRPLDGSPSILAQVRAPAFALAGLPDRDYELSVIDLDGFAWSPASQAAARYGEEAVFVREDDTPAVALALDPRDAASGDPLGDVRVQLQIGPRWSASAVAALREEPFAMVPRGTSFRFAAWAEGHRPVYGGDADFAGSGELRTARVELAPGFGARFQMKDLGAGFDGEDPEGRLAVLERPGVAGVEVWADGEVAATSDEQGIALVELPLEPQTIACAAPGWRVVGSDHLRGGRLAAEARDVVVWLVRE